MRKGGVVLIRVHPATADSVEKLVGMVMARGDSLVGQAALVTPWGIDTLPAGRNEGASTRELRIPGDGDQRSEVMSISIPN